MLFALVYKYLHDYFLFGKKRVACFGVVILWLVMLSLAISYNNNNNNNNDNICLGSRLVSEKITDWVLPQVEQHYYKKEDITSKEYKNLMNEKNKEKWNAKELHGQFLRELPKETNRELTFGWLKSNIKMQTEAIVIACLLYTSEAADE